MIRSGKFKKQVLIIILLAILMSTNPNNSDFNYYKNAKGFSSAVQGGRIGYFIFFSIYQIEYYPSANPSQKRTLNYIGILNNFIEVRDVTSSG